MADSTPYIVKKGDTLWDISKKFLGDPFKWPTIYEYNNKSEIVAKTGMRIANPDLIFVNQEIYIPANSAAARSATPLPGTKGKIRAKEKFRSIPFKYELDKVPVMETVTPLYTASVKLTGSVTIQSEKTFDILTINQNGFEVAAKKEADAVFSKLLAEASVGWDSKTREVKFGIPLTAESKNPFAPIISINTGYSSTSPGEPAIIISMKVPPGKIIRGILDRHYYAAVDFGVEIEITQHANPAFARSASPLPQAARSASPLPNTAKISVPQLPMFPSMAPLLKSPGSSTMPKPTASRSHIGGEHRPFHGINTHSEGMVLLTIAALTVGAIVIAAASIADDVIAPGLGEADDAASFAAVASMLDKAAKLYRATKALRATSALGAARMTPAFAY